MGHLFGADFVLAYDGCLKICEALSSLLVCVLCLRPNAHVANYVLYLIRIEVIMTLCILGAVISITIYIMHSLPCGHQKKHILAFQLYFHGTWFFIMVAFGCLVLACNLKTYPWNEVAKDLMIQQAQHPFVDIGYDCFHTKKTDSSGWQRLETKSFYRTYCVATDRRINSKPQSITILSYSETPEIIRSIGGGCLLLGGLFYLTDCILCIYRDRAPLKCSCKGKN